MCGDKESQNHLRLGGSARFGHFMTVPTRQWNSALDMDLQMRNLFSLLCTASSSQIESWKFIRNSQHEGLQSFHLCAPTREVLHGEKKRWRFGAPLPTARSQFDEFLSPLDKKNIRTSLILKARACISHVEIQFRCFQRELKNNLI